MKSNFFYSKSTGLYVSRKPLKINSRVKKAVEHENIKLNWDDEGRINLVDFDESKKILASLGSTMMSSIEYWKILKDTKEEQDEEMVQKLMSNKYCEWLERIYLIEENFIDHPKIISKYKYNGKKEKSN